LIHALLLSVHLLGVAFWIGLGFAQLYVGRQFRLARGTDLEAPLLRLTLRLNGWVIAATLTAAAAGVGLAVVTGLGFFHQLWLGAKQAIMLAVFAMAAAIGPAAARVGRTAALLPPGPGPASEAARIDLERMLPWEVAMRVAAVAALLLAVWRPN
jgi:hypothetical protein